MKHLIALVIVAGLMVAAPVSVHAGLTVGTYPEHSPEELFGDEYLGIMYLTGGGIVVDAPVATPEPTGAALLGLGTLALMRRRRR